MKIHNYGNDYAFQQYLRANKSCKTTEIKTETAEVDNVEHQIQTWGEGAHETGVEPETGEEPTQEVTHEKKKKKNYYKK